MKIRMCELVSHLTDNEGNQLFDVEEMKLVLAAKACIHDWSYIVHDKDVYSAEDENKNPEHKEGTLKPQHIHLLLRFQNNQPQDSQYVAKWFGVPENFINKIHGKFLDAVLYQTHKNSPEKYQYPVEEVHANFEYKEFIEKEMSRGDNIKSIIQDILDGRITEYDKMNKIDGILLVKHAKQINEAFKIRQEKIELTQQERNMQVIFITGKSASGKTTLAKKIATNQNLSFFVSSGSNDIMDGYKGQEVLILDDLRPSSLGLADLLKLTDPFTASSIKSRYKNKFLNCKILVITTVLSIDSFYEHVFSEEKEPIIQLKRRCGTYIRMDRDSINVSIWDNDKMRYSNEVSYKNDLLVQFMDAEKNNPQDVQTRVACLMPFLEEKESGFTLTPKTRKEKMENGI